MIFDQMDKALNAASVEFSSPMQFVLNEPDYVEFKEVPNLDRSKNSTFMYYRGVPVIQTELDVQTSVLNVRNARPIHENPIYL